MNSKKNTIKRLRLRMTADRIIANATIDALRVEIGELIADLHDEHNSAMAYRKQVCKLESKLRKHLAKSR